MPAIFSFIKFRFSLKINALLVLGLLLSAGPALAVPPEGGAESSSSRRSAQQRALDYDHRTAPRTVNLLGRFNAAEHRAEIPAKRRPAAPSMFFDLQRETEGAADAWYGKAGLQLKW